MHLFRELSKYIDVVVLAQPYTHSIKTSKEIEIINPHFKVIRYHGKRVRGIIYPKDLKSILEIERTNNCIVQCDEFFKFYTIQAAKFCRDAEPFIPLIISSRMRYRPGIIREFGLVFFRELAQEAVQRAYKIIATQGECSKEEFKRWFWLKQDSDFEIIPSGIDIEEFKKGYSEENKPKRDIILYVGRVYPIKRMDLALQVLKKVRAHNPTVELWIVGKEEDNELIKLNSLMKKLEFEHGKEVKFFGGIENKELHKYYSKAKLLINTSETEGICFSFLEGMSFKLPIVTWDVGGNSGVVKEGYNGFLEPFGDIDSFKLDILKILNNDKLRKELGENGFKLLKKEFNIKVNTQKLIKVYQEALK
jgi:glycosyltransferase involved in cell wall biosynthesis